MINFDLGDHVLELPIFLLEPDHPVLCDETGPLFPLGLLLEFLALLPGPLELLLQVPNLLGVLVVIGHPLECPSLPLLDPLHRPQLFREIYVFLSRLLQLRLELSETLVHLGVRELGP